MQHRVCANVGHTWCNDLCQPQLIFHTWEKIVGTEATCDSHCLFDALGRTGNTINKAENLGEERVKEET